MKYPKESYEISHGILSNISRSPIKYLKNNQISKKMKYLKKLMKYIKNNDISKKPMKNLKIQ